VQRLLFTARTLCQADTIFPSCRVCAHVCVCHRQTGGEGTEERVEFERDLLGDLALAAYASGHQHTHFTMKKCVYRLYNHTCRDSSTCAT